MRPSHAGKSLIATALGVLFVIVGCCELGRSDNESGSTGVPFGVEGQDGFFVPYYLNRTGGAENTFTDVDLSAQNDRIKKVISRDGIVATVIERYAARSGKVILDDDTVVNLTKLVENPCPSSLESCDEIASDQLGVAKQALIDNFDALSREPRNQGERGTCLAFAMAGAIEILLRRGGFDITVSPQDAYFMAKVATDTWSFSGLPPMETIDMLTRLQSGFVEEKFWPYNPFASNCQGYLNTHPGFVCSETEGQGGGSDGREREPQAESANQFKIIEAHQLCASLGRIKQALYCGYPVIMSGNANTDFNGAGLRNGVISWVGKQTNCGDDVCGHAFLAVGYQDDDNVPGGGYLILKNSWGPKWGDDGLALASYEWAKNSLLDAQAIVRVGGQP
jgi:C1A family cysteine protease